jgi:hypothetical protein
MEKASWHDSEKRHIKYTWESSIEKKEKEKYKRLVNINDNSY